MFRAGSDSLLLVRLWFKKYGSSAADSRFFEICPISSDAKKVLSIECLFNPPWINAELAAIRQGGDRSNVCVHHGDTPGRENRYCYDDARRFPIQTDRLGTVHLKVDDCSYLERSLSSWCFQDHRSFEILCDFDCKDFVSKSHAGWQIRQSYLFDIRLAAAVANPPSPLLLKGPKRRRGLDKNLHGISGNVGSLQKAGRVKEALHILNQQGIQAGSDTYVCFLQECINMRDLAEGKEVHAHIVQSGLKPNVSLLNNLIDMYAKCGSVADARRVFDNMPERTLFTWTIMIAGYAKRGSGREALEIYEQMQRKGVTPNRVTFICIVNACAKLGALDKGKEVHADVIKAGIGPYIILDTALADMYAKCGSMKNAREVFDKMAKRNVVSWNAMIGGYAQHGCGREALKMYEQMQQAGVTPDRITFICILNACASLGALEKGKEVHADIIKTEIASNVILETALADMYAKCGSMMIARQVFENMAQRDVIAWNAIIGGYSQHGCGREAFEMYKQMQLEGLTPDSVTFICVLNGCASLGALEKGREVHTDISNVGIASHIILENALIDMYAKCGSMKDAHQVFHNMAKRDVVSWNAMMAGYAQHGFGRDALQLFQQMEQEGCRPVGATFISLLSACSHVGLVDEGLHYFDSMSRDYGLTPTVEHFSCIVDLLGRAGRLDEAEDLIKYAPIKPDVGVWRTLLGACRIHGDLELAERAAESMF